MRRLPVSGAPNAGSVRSPRVLLQHRRHGRLRAELPGATDRRQLRTGRDRRHPDDRRGVGLFENRELTVRAAERDRHLRGGLRSVRRSRDHPGADALAVCNLGDHTGRRGGGVPPRLPDRSRSDSGRLTQADEREGAAGSAAPSNVRSLPWLRRLRQHRRVPAVGELLTGDRPLCALADHRRGGVVQHEVVVPGR